MQKNYTLLFEKQNIVKSIKRPGIEFFFNAWVFLFLFENYSPRSPPFHSFLTSRNEKTEDLKMALNQKEIGQRIAKIRNENNLTQEEFANIMNISVSLIGKIEIGNRGLSLDLIAEISTFFNISTDYILLGKSTENHRIKQDLNAIIKQLSTIENRL